MTGTNTRGGAPATGKPTKSRPLLWMGCGALPVLLIGGIGLLVYAVSGYIQTHVYEGVAAAQVKHLQSWEEVDDPLGQHKSRCFVGAVANTGNLSVRTSIDFTFYDAAGARVGHHKWSSALRVLQPGELEPFSTCTFAENTGVRHVQQLDVDSVYFRGSIVSLETQDVAVRETAPHTYEVEGAVRNNAKKPMPTVRVAISLLGPTGEVVGGGVAYPKGGAGLAPGEVARFTNPGIRGAIEKARVEVRAIGYDGY
jgi:hypothetical protein